MDRIEPRQDNDWQSIEFRRPSWSRSTGEDPRFAIGLGVFLLVALAFPWYGYWVVSHLLERDARQVVAELQTESDRVSAQLSAQSVRDGEAQRANAQATADQLERRRIAAVRVLGVSSSTNPPVVLVNLGSSNLLEADAEVCRQAAGWLNRRLSGTVIRVQRFRGNSPAADAGQLACP